MNKILLLKRKFDSLNGAYKERQLFFKHRVECWGKKGKLEWCTRGKELLAFLDNEAVEIKKLFADDHVFEKTAELSAKITSFKKAYKQLNESTKSNIRQWVEALVFAGLAALVLRSFIFGLYHVPSGSAEPTVLVGDRVWGNKLAYWYDDVKRGDLVIFDDPRFVYEPGSLKGLWQKYIGLPIPLLGIESGPINVVKRVIAIPGDQIEGRIENGRTVIYLNGQKLEEAYVNPYPLILLEKNVGLLPFNHLGPIKLPGWLGQHPYPVRYTYDPDKSFEDQPFYAMSKLEVIQREGYSPLAMPFTPTYRDYYETDCADVFGPFTLPQGKYWVMGDSRKNSQDSRWFGFLDKSYIQGRLSFIIYSVDSQEPLWVFELLKHPIDFWFNGIRWNRFFKKPTPVVTATLVDKK